MKIAGISIKLHISWYFAIGLITYTLSTSYFPKVAPEITSSDALISSIITSLLVFGSVLIHELAHSIMAKLRGVNVSEIVLHLFGGVSRLDGEIRDARSEFLVSVIGPMSSLVIGIICMFFGEGHIYGYLALINLVLFGFNLIPAFPLDGGRILRSIAWMITGDYVRATKISAMVGIRISSVLLALGIILIIGNIRAGIWLLGLGGFILLIGDSTFKQLKGIKNLDFKVADLMIPATEIKRITWDMPIEDICRSYFIPYGFNSFPVIDSKDEVIGTLDTKKLFKGGNGFSSRTYDEMLRQIKGKNALELLQPISSDELVYLSTDTRKAFEIMLLFNKDRLYVFNENKELAGMILKSAVVRRAKLEK